MIFLQRECDGSVVNAGDSKPHGVIPPGINPPAAESPLKADQTSRGPVDASALARFEAVVLPHLDAAYTLHAT